MTAVTISHIVLDERGRAFIEGTRTRVAMVVMDKMNGLSPERIREEYPYLSLAQIYGALAYYYDNQAELDSEIEGGRKEVEALRAEAIASGRQLSRAELEKRLSQRKKGP